MTLGPLMLDLGGTALTAEEREMLAHPIVGGVILFSRNYESPEQIAELIGEVHALRSPHLLVAVDHEGGRVQRFRQGFTSLPAAALYGRLYATDRERALRLARAGGWLMAAELRAVGVDFSFAPVLDLLRGISRVIDDRAFHRDPEAVAELARSFMRGMNEAGMAAVGKHFPGHGSVESDSHVAVPLDPRPLADIRGQDLLSFERMIHYGLVAIMPAHVVYPAVDERPAGYSPIWLQGILRGELGFQGAILSDDLSMVGAHGAGGPVERARMALEAGCDMVLVCNDRKAVTEVIEGLEPQEAPASRARLVRLHGRRAPDWEGLRGAPQWKKALELVASLEPEPELALGDDGLS